MSDFVPSKLSTDPQFLIQNLGTDLGFEIQNFSDFRKLTQMQFVLFAIL